MWAAVSAHPRVSTALTWRADIKPLFDRQCVSCHAPGNASNTVPLATYEQVRPWIAAIREEVLERRMPVPRGRPGIDAGVDDHPLSPMERDVIVGWIDGGAPEGRAAASAGTAGAAGAPGTTATSGAATEAETPAATFWCRMHPEIRADRAGTCPLCGMELAAFTPDLAQRYGWTVKAGPSSLTLRVTDTATNTPIRDFERVHEYPLHLFVVSEDFRDFQHVHPEMNARGEWTVPWRAAQRGRYFVYGDFLPAGGAPQMLQRMISVDASSRRNAAATAAAAADADASGLKATLNTPTPTLRTGDEARITIALTDAKSGAAIGDLQPYLGAWGHLFVLHEGRDEALHAHPDTAGTTPGGPNIAFDVLFPRPGTYHLWMQVQRRGAIVTLPFVVRVSPRA
jgi:heavy metal-binding protein